YPTAIGDIPGIGSYLARRQEACPGARVIAGRILTLPTQPGVTPRDIEAMVRIIRGDQGRAPEALRSSHARPGAGAWRIVEAQAAHLGRTPFRDHSHVSPCDRNVGRDARLFPAWHGGDRLDLRAPVDQPEGALRGRYARRSARERSHRRAAGSSAVCHHLRRRLARQLRSRLSHPSATRSSSNHLPCDRFHRDRPRLLAYRAHLSVHPHGRVAFAGRRAHISSLPESRAPRTETARAEWTVPYARP